MLEEKTKQEQQRLTPSIGEGVHNVQSRYEYVIVCGCFAASALCIWGCFIIGKLDHQINEEIRDKELRVIGANGDQLGIMSSADALALAEEKELDLVKIAPNAVPPVNTKVKNAMKFLKDGNRVKVTVRFRGREMAHTSLGEVLLKQFGESCAEVATVEKGAKLEGRNMSMFLSPKNSK